MEESIKEGTKENIDGAIKESIDGAVKESIDGAAKGSSDDGVNSNSADSLLEQINEMFSCDGKDLRTYSPLALAYIGDAVYDLVVRSVVVERANRPVQALHGITVKYVKAQAQAEIIEALQGSLTEEEEAIFRRGRNAKPHTLAKNASAADYHKATGFEALLGYLYLSGQTRRMLELVRAGMAFIDGNGVNIPEK